MNVELEGEKHFVFRMGFLGKIRGLMFSKRRKLLFDLYNQKEMIHSLFVFFPIKLYFLDKDFKILEKTTLRPFWFYIPKVKAKWLVEIPQ
jgi:uncharacterized membrane protein (UPF0127 family)